MDEENIINLDDAKLRKLKNLRAYKDMPDEEIRRRYLEKQITIKRPVARKMTSKPTDKIDDSDKKFRTKLRQLQRDNGIDMNDSNDAENLKNLARQQIMPENATRDIDLIQGKDSLASDDYLKLEKLGKFQSGILASIATLEDKLGISRKYRKDKQVDDATQFISSLLAKSKTYFDKQTIKITCPKCKIELGRFWLNFPSLKNEMDLNMQCQNCEEMVLYSR